MSLLRKRNVLAAPLLIGLGAFLAWGNSGAQTFSDQTSALGLSLAEAGAAWGDYDADGWVDLIVGHQVWRNAGGTHFTLAFTLTPLLSDDDYDIWADYDNDGFLDVASWDGTILRIFHNDDGIGFTSIALPTIEDVTKSRAVA
jgi:hypothetical protein